ncbi:hypothetical protein [Laspinema palackyanum]|nr:hypothetical protein [Laspinema sp. D2c]
MSLWANSIFEAEGALPLINKGAIAIKFIYFIIGGTGPEGSSLAKLAL